MESFSRNIYDWVWKAVLPECIKYEEKYVDDTVSFVKLGTIEYIITKLIIIPYLLLKKETKENYLSFSNS